jgi:enamine deaminase RidA (YjgF/YER057c/UK114 family)
MANRSVVGNGRALPTAPFAPAVLSEGSRILTISGQIADDEDGRIVGIGDAEEQARQCLRNVDALLEAAGASRRDIVRIGVFLTDMRDRDAVARARSDYFGEHKPASTLVEVTALVSPELKVEIEATAMF